MGGKEAFPNITKSPKHGKKNFLDDKMTSSWVRLTASNSQDESPRAIIWNRNLMKRTKRWITAILVSSGLVLLMIFQREGSQTRAATVNRTSEQPFFLFLHFIAIYDTNHKMIFKRETRDTSFEFYNLIQDQAEQRDIMKSASIPSALEKALTDFVKGADSYKIPFQVKHPELEDRSGFVKNRNGQEKLTAEDEEKLHALGYVD